MIGKIFGKFFIIYIIGIFLDSYSRKKYERMKNNHHKSKNGKFYKEIKFIDDEKYDLS
jgi:hypothetical protein